MVSLHLASMALVSSCLVSSKFAHAFTPLPFATPRVKSNAAASAPSQLHMSSSTAEATGTTALDTLATMTTISIDSCDLDVVTKYAETGDVTDATTNPFFVWQMASKGDSRYEDMVTDAIVYAKEEKMTPYGFDELDPVINLAMDKLAVNLGAKLASIVPRRVSTEVDVRLCHDVDASVTRAKKIIDMYKEMGIGKDRVLIELAGTWEGIQAASVLEKEGIQTKITLVFSFLQAAAAAQAGVYMVSPFPGRILDWHVAKTQGKREQAGYVPDADPGVLTTKRIYSYLRHYNYDTICMPASWRSSGAPGGNDLDEILALAGIDEMNVPPSLLESLITSDAAKVVKRCDAKAEAAVCIDPDFKLKKDTWDVYWGTDRCAKEKLQEGIDTFSEDAERLAEIIVERFN